ncbi:MAG: hypothetical protein EOP11_05155 [Proteobacteria bacterium]|nr:MAG: hypothetical protein EOP11_05155 [Pseudomonadota bacterium]
MKVILALLLGLGLGFFFSRAGSAPPPLTNQPESNAALIPSPPPVAAATPAVPSPMSAAGPKPSWNARTNPLPDASDRRRLLGELTEADIETWRVLRREKIAEFLKTNGEFWHVGREPGEKESGAVPPRLDAKVVQSALGTYECTMKYNIREMPGTAVYRFRLGLNSADGSRDNSLTMKGGRAGAQGSMASTFKWEYLGTEGRDVNVVWYNSFGNEHPYVTNFAFRLRGGMDIGGKETTPLMGLSPDLKWAEIGTMEIRRAK